MHPSTYARIRVLRMRSVGRSMCVLLVFLLRGAPSALAQSSIGAISASVGQGSLRRGTQSFKVKVGMTVADGDEIITGVNGAVTAQTIDRD
jgi:hypothetical protein